VATDCLHESGGGTGDTYPRNSEPDRTGGATDLFIPLLAGARCELMRRKVCVWRRRKGLQRRQGGDRRSGEAAAAMIE
jgi:hypothetical protein